MFRSSKKKAFTLLELIVVVVVLGILAALAIPSFSAVKTTSVEKTALSSAESVLRNAKALAAFDGAALSDSYLDQAGSELGVKYNPDSNTVTITSSGLTGVATIDALTGTITIAGSASSVTTAASESAATLATKISQSTSALDAALPTYWVTGTDSGQASWSASHPVLLLLQNQSNPNFNYGYTYITNAQASAIAQSWRDGWLSWNMSAAPSYGGSNSISPYIFHLDSDPGYGSNLVIDSWASYTMMKLDGDFTSSSTRILETTF
jgi:prepilin-type N-terminal cleavage/methylation domain-containing protein